MADNNVTPLFGAKEIPECPVEIKHAPLALCEHEKILLHEHSRTVSCARCNQVFDPFDFLKKDANRLVRAWHLHREVMNDVKNWSEKLDELKKQVARARSFIKRHADKDGEAVKVK